MKLKVLTYPIGTYLLGGIFSSMVWGIDKLPIEYTVSQEAAVISPLIEQLLRKESDLPLNTRLGNHTARAASAGQAELKAIEPEASNSKRSPPPDIIAEGVIVRFKSPTIQALARANQPPPEEAIATLEAALGEHLIFHGAMVGEAHVFRFATPIAGKIIIPLLQRAESLPGIEWIEADTRVKARLMPNDLRFNQQWNLRSISKSAAGGIKAIRAWNITRGSSDTVVAVIDTGVRPHPEFAARLLPGYDFISDLENANDGDGPDNNASDPGDWRLEGECGESARDSSWHGTFVTGIIAAQGDNRMGIAGVNWNTRILPVRVLGKCDGIDSDILNGMAWAAGLPVPGVPLNPHPAQIINLSLAGYSPFGCPQSYKDTINKILEQGILIVVASGNKSDDMRYYSPANCKGVLPVIATDYDGDLASYSNWSLTTGGRIAAPGGSFWHGILSTIVRGPTTPVGFTYAWGDGTSIAAPHVSGVASLALAVDPHLSGEELYSLLQLASRPFPAGTRCANEEICGAGIADASNTVMAASILSMFRLVYEFYNTQLNHYFLTGAKKEAAIVNRGGAGPGWRSTGSYFYAWSGPEEGALPVCRFYTQGANSHFYTASPKDCAFLRSLNPENVLADDQWTYEGIAFYAKLPVKGICPSESTPIYRAYNNRWMYNDSNHRFTSSLKDYESMIAQGWLGEGIAFCVAATTQG